MAFAYQKTSTDKTFILGAREQVARQFDFGTDWTEIRIGMFWSPVSLASNNAAASLEGVPVSTVLDRYFFGIKDNSGLVPGQAGSRYLGLTNRTGSALTSIVASTRDIWDQDPFGSMGAGGAYDTTFLNVADQAGVIGVADPSPSTSYCQYRGLRFVVVNRGLSSQTVKISSSVTATPSPVSGADYSAAALRSILSAFGNETSQVTVNWNNGSVAYDLPDSWFLRNPFFNNRFRVSCMNALKIAP